MGFIYNYNSTLTKISNWELYRRAILTSEMGSTADLVEEVTLIFKSEVTMISVSPVLSALINQMNAYNIQSSGHGFTKMSSEITFRVYDAYSEF